jgi:hypothetical protein
MPEGGEYTFGMKKKEKKKKATNLGRPVSPTTKLEKSSFESTFEDFLIKEGKGVHTGIGNGALSFRSRASSVEWPMAVAAT